MVILRGNDVTLRWTITRCLDGSEAPEDFSSAELSVVIQSYYNRVRVNASVDGNVIIITIPGNAQQSGKITLEAAWSKNEGKNWSRAKQVDVIEFTDDPNRVTSCGNGADVDVHTIPLKSAMFGSVGHDGLTPEIGDNGNWWIGSIDTGIPATGPQGDAFTFGDFTPAQIVELQKPALDAAESVSQIEQVASGNEQVRVQSEADRRNSEQSRSNNESTRAADELARATSEATRVENESTRILAENQRVSQEQGRGQAEQKREERESTRVENETARISNETQRGKDETTRKNNETARVDAESIRSTNEVDRTSKESTRVTNESDRIAAETQRFNSETTRKSAENLRLSEEVTRKNNETGRVSEEAKRTVSETGRVNAEGLRVAAESKRQADTSAAITRTDAAASNATTQAGYAKEQADLAKEAIAPLIPSLNVLYPSVPIYSRINTDAGIVRSKKSLNGLTQFLLDLRENTKLLFCPELGVKLRTSGADNYIAKLYDISPMLNDASQTTALNQPFLSGNIAPNEKYALKNPNGVNSYITHTPISFSATDKWSVSTMINFNGSSDTGGANVYYAGQSNNGFGLQVGTNTYIRFRNPINFKDYRYTGHIGKNAIITWSALGNSSISLFINGRLIQTFTGLDTSIIISEIGRGYSIYYNVGAISYHAIRNIAISPKQASEEYTYLRSLFPEIESVQIGTQTWTTSNCEMVFTPQGNIIKEMLSANNVERITNADDREFSSDTGFWAKGAGWTIDGGMANANIGASPSCLSSKSVNAIGRWYKVQVDVTIMSGSVSYIAGGAGSQRQLISGVNTFYLLHNGNTGQIVFVGFPGFIGTIDNVSVEEIGWSDSTNLYDYVYANTTGTVEQKEYAAVKAAAMWCYYNNDPILGATYGKLYNWYAVKLLQMDIDYYNAANPTSPWGWRVPTSADFTTLSTYLGGDAVAGGKMKKEGTAYWRSPNVGGDNSSNFSGIAGGYRASTTGSYQDYNSTILLRTIDKNRIRLSFSEASLDINTITDGTGCSLRLIKA